MQVKKSCQAKILLHRGEGGGYRAPLPWFTRREERQISSWFRETVWEYVPNRGWLLVPAVTTNCDGLDVDPLAGASNS